MLKMMQMQMMQTIEKTGEVVTRRRIQQRVATPVGAQPIEKVFRFLIATMLLHAAIGMHAAHAAGGMNVDDAQIMDADTCQLESWAKFNRNGTERWFSPACSPNEHVEVSWAGAWQRDLSGMYLATSQFQGKTVFRELSSDATAIGMLAGAERVTEGMTESDSVRQTDWNYYAKLLTTTSFRDNDILLHTNLGVTQSKQDHTTSLTWGVGNESRLFGQATLIAEVFGENKGRASYQAGLRYALIPEQLELDLTYGNRFGRETAESYFVLGLRFIAPALFR